LVEADYWVRLAFRICREFAGMSDRHLQYLWCDGITPEEYLLDDPAPRITGRAWICNGPKQDEWNFTLFLPHPVDSREEINWASLLPPENVTRWLALDRGRCIQIDPLAAVPDLAQRALKKGSDTSTAFC
jgi:hypothetical protein